MSEPIIEVDAETPMRDGTVLRSLIVRPSSSDTHPVAVLLQRGPYLADWRTIMATFPEIGDRTDALAHMMAGAAGLTLPGLLEAGFAVVITACRGTDRSDGVLRWMVDEASDGVDLAHWVADQAWCDGRVLGQGGSYLSATQMATVLADSDALAAVSPWIAPSDPANDMGGRGGIPRFALSVAWARDRAHDAARRAGEPAPADLPLSIEDPVGAMLSLTPEQWAERLERYPQAQHATGWLRGEPGAYDPGTYALDDLESLDVPGFHLAGWYDVFLGGTLRNYTAMRRGPAGEQQHLVIGPWTHMDQSAHIPGYAFPPQSTLIGGGVAQLQLDFWRRHGRDADVALPRVRLYVMGADAWRDVDDWPLPEASDRDLYLGDGTLAWVAPTASAAVTWAHDPDSPVPIRGGQELFGDPADAGPLDQRPVEEHPGVVSFTTEPLPEAVEVIGPVRLRAFVSSDAPTLDLHATLTDVAPDGTSRILTDGCLRIDTSAGVAEADVDLWSTANRFEVGHGVRVNLAASSWPRYLISPERPAQVTVHCSADQPSRLVVPVVTAR